jgi:heme O synthase-like polyprenyltransferase
MAGLPADWTPGIAAGTQVAPSVGLTPRYAHFDLWLSTAVAGTAAAAVAAATFNQMREVRFASIRRPSRCNYNAHFHINQVDTDGLMMRTRLRPLVTEAIPIRSAAAFGVAMTVSALAGHGKSCISMHR